MTTHTAEPTLLVRDLCVDVQQRGMSLPAVTNLSFDVWSGECVGIVGESGSGKTLSALAVIGLLPKAARRVSGSIVLGERRVAGPTHEEVTDRRREGLAMVFQNPMTSLNPSLPVGDQITEAVAVHEPGISSRDARRRALELLGLVEIRDAERSAARYPHEFSGGMQQRVMIAIAMACQPKILIADEPTTALDVTIQKNVMDLLNRLRQSTGMGVILISHDLALVGERCERALVMYAGELVEEGPTRQVLAQSRHPYVAALTAATPSRAVESGVLVPLKGRVPGPGEAPRNACRFAPRCEYVIDRCTEEHPMLMGIGSDRQSRCFRANDDIWTTGLPASAIAHGDRPLREGTQASRGVILSMESVTKRFVVSSRGRKHDVIAVDGVDLAVADGESLGLVGESGSGKSTLGRIACGLLRPESGNVVLAGDPIFGRRTVDRNIWKTVQFVFQDPYSSLNPTMRVGRFVAEPLRLWNNIGRRDAARQATELLEQVGLDPRIADALPRSLSGGQQQRVSIARALAVRPRLVILDEPVTSLDVSVQAEILTLLRSLRAQFDVAYLFIGHDIAVVRAVCDRVAVMFEGRIVEICDSKTMTPEGVKNEYTRSLMTAIPKMPVVESDLSRVIETAPNSPSSTM